MPNPGYVGIDEILAGTRVVQMEDAILNNFPDAAPLLSLSNRMGRTRNVQDMVFYWMTDDPGPRRVPLAYAYVGGTDIIIEVAAGYGKYFHPHGMFIGSNGVQYRTLSITYGTGGHSTNDCITFEKTSKATYGPYNSAYEGTWSGTTFTDTNLTSAHNMAATTDYLYIMPTSQGEKADAEESYTTDPTIVTQRCQNFYTAVSLSTIADRSQLYGGNHRKNEHSKRQVELAQQIELAWFLGKMGSVSASTGEGTTWMMNGIKNILSTNVYDCSSAVLTEDLLISKIPQSIEYAKIEDLAFFCTSAFIGQFASFGRDALDITPDDKTWGFRPTVWRSPFGDIPLIHARILDYWKSGYEAYLLDTNEFKKVLFTDGALKMMPNRQTSVQYQKILDIYCGIHSMQYGREKFHSLFHTWVTS